MPTPHTLDDRVACRRAWWRPPAAAVLGSCLAAACGDVPTATRAGPEQPVIEFLLVAGRDTQTVTVRYSLPADGVIQLAPRPIPADSVLLSVEDEAGSVVPLAAIDGAPGTYHAVFAVVPGGRYHLTGTVAGRLVTASTQVPQPLTIYQPAGDTLRMRDDDRYGSTLEDVPFAWSAPGAAGYLVQIVSTERPSERSRLIEDTVGVLIPDLDLRPGRADTSRFEVWALDSVTTAFLRPTSATTPRPGNIEGALGYFGAAVPAPAKVVLWQ